MAEFLPFTRAATTPVPSRVRASRKLENDSLLITKYAGTNLRLELDKVPLWPGQSFREQHFSTPPVGRSRLSAQLVMGPTQIVGTAIPLTLFAQRARATTAEEGFLQGKQVMTEAGTPTTNAGLAPPVLPAWP